MGLQTTNPPIGWRNSIHDSHIIWRFAALVHVRRKTSKQSISLCSGTAHIPNVQRQINELDYWRENREHLEEMERLKVAKRNERQRNAQIRKVMKTMVVLTACKLACQALTRPRQWKAAKAIQDPSRMCYYILA